MVERGWITLGPIGGAKGISMSTGGGSPLLGTVTRAPAFMYSSFVATRV